MAKKTYRRFSKKGLSKKNKLRKSKRKSLRSKRKSRKHGGLPPVSITRGEYWGHESCGTKRGNLADIICQSKKVKAYSNSNRLRDFGQLSEHEEKLTESIKKYGEDRHVKIPDKKIDIIKDAFIKGRSDAITIINSEVSEIKNDEDGEYFGGK